MNKIDLLYDHYKESFSLSKTFQDERNSLFVKLCVIIAIHFLFIIEPESLLLSFYSWLSNSMNVNITLEFCIIQSLLWIILLYFTIRYYQVNIYIERQYNYIHALENSISNLIKFEFDRESKNYLMHYPLILDIIYLFYKVIFPFLYLVILLIKIYFEYATKTLSRAVILDSIIFAFCEILTISYLSFSHKKFLLKAFNKIFKNKKP